MNTKQIALLIPCYNEELTIASVIKDFQDTLPTAKIYVYNNNSTDDTAKIAQKAGAIVKNELRQGKGNTIKTMLKDIDADIYVLIDGDGAHSAKFLNDMIKLILNRNVDMVIGCRYCNKNFHNKRLLHNFGNKLITFLINKLYKSDLKDVLSGYRVLSKDFVKNININSTGFEIESEITIHALEQNYEIYEMPIICEDRVDGSYSKLNTFIDGFKIVKSIFKL
ncbi:glycosyltransferase family 2 protein [Sulfurimonas sp.]